MLASTRPTGGPSAWAETHVVSDDDLEGRLPDQRAVRGY